MNVTFNNAFGEGDDNISVFWLNFSGLREYPFEGGGIGVPYAILNPGQSIVQPTYVTYPWIPHRPRAIRRPATGSSCRSRPAAR